MTDLPSTVSRRTAIAAVGSAVAASAAGCGGSTRDGDHDAAADRTTTPGGAASTTTTTTDRLALPAVSVEGLPDGRLPLRPEGKVAFLNFFSRFCSACKGEMEFLRGLRERYDEDDVWLLSVTAATYEPPVREFWTDHDATWPVVMDPDLAAASRYDATSYPTNVVLTPGGTNVVEAEGLPEPHAPREMRAAVDSALAMTGGE